MKPNATPILFSNRADAEKAAKAVGKNAFVRPLLTGGFNVVVVVAGLKFPLTSVK